MYRIGSKGPRYALRTTSSWKQFDAWRSARKAAAQKYIDNSSAFAAGWSAAIINNTQGMANLAAQAATKRITSEAAAKVSQAQSVLDDAQATLNKLV